MGKHGGKSLRTKFSQLGHSTVLTPCASHVLSLGSSVFTGEMKEPDNKLEESPSSFTNSGYKFSYKAHSSPVNRSHGSHAHWVG